MGNKLLSFLGRLIGSGGERATDADSGTKVEYQGFEIRPTSRREGSQWLTAGVITKRVEGEVKEHRFVRVDRHVTKEDAEAFAIVKAKQIIDEQGDNLFKDA